jgi:hypothetical protein
LNAPVGELESQSSVGSTTPLPQSTLVVEVEVELDVVGVDVLEEVLDEELVVVTVTQRHCAQTSPG